MLIGRMNPFMFTEQVCLDSYFKFEWKYGTNWLPGTKTLRPAHQPDQLAVYVLLSMYPSYCHTMINAIDVTCHFKDGADMC